MTLEFRIIQSIDSDTVCSDSYNKVWIGKKVFMRIVFVSTFSPAWWEQQMSLKEN